MCQRRLRKIEYFHKYVFELSESDGKGALISGVNIQYVHSDEKSLFSVRCNDS